MPHHGSGDLLAVLLDLNPVAWDACSGDDGGLSLHTAIEAVLVLCNAHLALSHENHICVAAATLTHSSILHSSLNPHPHPSAALELDHGDPNIFQQFRAVDSEIIARLKTVLTTQSVPAQETAPSLKLVGALTKTLCHIKRFSQPDPAKPPLNPRILIISLSPDTPSQHIPIMNSIFSAQKDGIIVDVCKVHGPDTVFLQQATHLTSGIYYRLEHPAALLQYLLVTFLSGPSSRRLLNLPSQDHVDLRAACFCHRKIVDMGYVCSVCLSIHCSPRPICVTCKSKFPISTLKRLR